MSMSRRQFLQAAAAGAATLGAGAYLLADGPGDSYPVQGLDVSHWQGTINWDQVAAAGYKFCFCKATEDTTYVDPTFATNWAGMKRVGIARGAYHMVRPSIGTPIAQADHFLDTVKPSSGDLRPVLDVEKNDGLTAAQVWQFLQLMAYRIKARLGRAPILYTGFYFWRDSVGYPRSNLDCPLWFARWSYPIPTTEFPSATWAGWSFWQYASTDTPAVPGIGGAVDRDAFYGSPADLNKFRLP
jgi:lysozyme